MFDYLAVLISVVLGFAVTHVLTGMSGAINRRDDVRIDWLQMFWALNVLAYVLAVWWGMYWWSTCRCGRCKPSPSSPATHSYCS